MFQDEQDQETQETTNSSPSFESILVPGRDGYLHPFGESHLTHMAKKRAFIKATFAQEALERLNKKLGQLSPDSGVSSIQATLREVEDTVQFAQEYAASIPQSDLTKHIAEGSNQYLSSLRNQLKSWRDKYPDTTPLRIDNSQSVLFLLGTLRLLIALLREGFYGSRCSSSDSHTDCVLHCPSQ